MTINRDTILRVVVCVQFFMTSLVLLASWLPPSYLLSQCLILALGFWAIVHRESVIQVELLMLIKFVSIILDSIAIGLYFQLGKKMNEQATTTPFFAVSAAFAIILLILKPIMLLLLNKVRQDRLGDPNFGNWAGASGYIPVDGR